MLPYVKNLVLHFHISDTAQEYLHSWECAQIALSAALMGKGEIRACL